MIAPDAAEMSTVLASSMPRYPLRMLRPTRPTSARTAQIRSMFHPLRVSAVRGDPGHVPGGVPGPTQREAVDGHVVRLEGRACVRRVEERAHDDVDRKS